MFFFTSVEIYYSFLYFFICTICENIYITNGNFHMWLEKAMEGPSSSSHLPTFQKKDNNDQFIKF